MFHWPNSKSDKNVCLSANRTGMVFIVYTYTTWQHFSQTQVTSLLWVSRKMFLMCLDWSSYLQIKHTGILIIQNRQLLLIVYQLGRDLIIALKQWHCFFQQLFTQFMPNGLLFFGQKIKHKIIQIFPQYGTVWECSKNRVNMKCTIA